MTHLTAEQLLQAYDAQPLPPLRPFLDLTGNGRAALGGAFASPSPRGGEGGVGSGRGPANVLVHEPRGAQTVTHVLHPAIAAGLVAETLPLLTDAPEDDDRVDMLQRLAVFACVALADRIEASRNPAPSAVQVAG